MSATPRFLARVSCLVCCVCLSLLSGAGWAVTVTSYEHHVAIDPADAPGEIIAKAARVVPSRAQLLHHADGFIGFIHFGPNTFNGVEWGSGTEDPAVFDPGDTLDTDQWCRIMKAAGMSKVVITTKHHDGFCLWQTRYNDAFSVRAVPWRGGQGDVLRELSESCRKHGLKLGLYLSPADLYQMESPSGLYGNLSTSRPSVIPTAVDVFQTEPTRVRPDKPEGAPTFAVEADDYNRYFMNQLYELLTEYGPIHEVWFDGAHPKRKGGQQYLKTEWFRMIRALAPEAVIFGGPDVRWCGNEAGGTRESEWSVLPVQDELASGVDRTAQELGTDAKLLEATYEVYGTTYRPGYLYYLISEVDTSIRAGWFWRNDHEQSVRTPEDVFEIYERSVGGNATFLLNVPPNNQGRISARDEECLREVGRRIRETYAVNLAARATATDADAAPVPGLIDADLSTYWQAPAGVSELLVTLPAVQAINRFVLQEAVGQVGQRIKSHALDAWIDNRWQEVASATTVGYRRILGFPAVTTDRLRVRILDARLTPGVAEISAHHDGGPRALAAGPVVYKTVGDVDLRLHVFRPDGLQPTDKRPAIVFFFGGGWVGGTPEQFYPQSEYFADLGMVALSAEYRVRSRHGTTPFDSVEDAKSAVRWIRQNAGELGIDPDRIVAAGGSAGGHLALCCALVQGLDADGEDSGVSSVPNAVIAFNPVVDTTETGLGVERFGQDRKTEASPVHLVRKGLPPVLIFHGTADKTVPFENVDRFARRMREEGNRCTLQAFAGKGHGFFNSSAFRPGSTDDDCQATLKASAEFLTELGFLPVAGVGFNRGGND